MSDLGPGTKHSFSMEVFEARLASFTTELSGLGYRAMVVHQKRATAVAFARWAVRRRLDIAAIDETTVEAFLVSCGRRRIPIGNRDAGTPR
jgi:hypothetical protein